MNKQELVDAVSATSGLPKTVTSKALDSFYSVVSSTIQNGNDEVRIANFGTFCSIKRDATTGRNPQTGETITIPASYQPKFRAGKGLKEIVNKK